MNSWLYTYFYHAELRSTWVLLRQAVNISMTVLYFSIVEVKPVAHGYTASKTELGLKPRPPSLPHSAGLNVIGPSKLTGSSTLRCSFVGVREAL